MKIECTAQELKELINNKTPVEVTTDAMLNEKQLEQINKHLANNY